MYKQTEQDIARRFQWIGLVNQAYQNGEMPAPPETLAAVTAPIVQDKSDPALPLAPFTHPLPDGVTAPQVGTGAVQFHSGIKDPNKANAFYLWYGIIPNLVPGTIEYATVSWNTQMADLELSAGWLIAVGKKMDALFDTITGGTTFRADTTASQNLDPAVLVIPEKYRTVQQALDFINGVAAK